MRHFNLFGMAHFRQVTDNISSPPREFGSARRLPIAGQITAAGVRRLDGLVIFVGTKRTGVDVVVIDLLSF